MNLHNQTTNLVQKLIAKIDGLLNTQVNIILHHLSFQKLEASWRSLYALTLSVAKLNHVNIKIKLLNISWNVLSKDLTRATEFDQSNLFRLVYNEEFGSPGGEPYGLLLGDYEISHQIFNHHLYNHLTILSHIAKVAAAAFAPFITMPSPSLFGLDNFSSFERDLNIERMFQQTEYLEWKSLRQEEEMRFVGLILPKMLQRLPYKTHHFFTDPCHFNFSEIIQTSKDYLWGNSCYAFAANIARAFAQSGWFADIRGAVSDSGQGGVVEDLPICYLKSDIQHIAPLFITDVCMTEQQEKNLSDFGFIALSHCKYTHLHAFYSCPSLYQIKRYDLSSANINEKLSSMLNYVLCTARFAHYLKMIARNKIGSFTTAEDCAKILGDWLRQYTASGNDLSRELQAKYPLRDARVEMTESIGKPGAFNCKIHLSPHYRFEQIETYLQLTTEIY